MPADRWRASPALRVQCFNEVVSGVLSDEPPTKRRYSPASRSQSFFASSKIDRNFGSSFSVTVLDSPGASWIFSHATSRFGGSLAAAGRPA